MSFTNQVEFVQVWNGIATTSGPANGGTAVVVSGKGFNTASQYTCRFATETDVMDSVAVHATSPTELTCETPAWGHTKAAVAVTFTLHDATGAAIALEDVDTKLEIAAPLFVFTPVLLHITQAIGADDGSETLVKASCSGLDPTVDSYHCLFTRGTGEHAQSAEAPATVTSYTQAECTCPGWDLESFGDHLNDAAFQYTSVAIVKDGGTEVELTLTTAQIGGHDARNTFMESLVYTPAPDYTSQGGAHGGTTLNFALDWSHETPIHPTCRFVDTVIGLNHLDSAQGILTVNADSSSASCVAPAWGSHFEAGTTYVYLYSDSHIMKVHRMTGYAPIVFTFHETWHTQSAVTGEASGGLVLILTGHGFISSFHKYRCLFVDGTTEVVSEYATVNTLNEISCVTPKYGAQHASTSTSLYLVKEGFRRGEHTVVKTYEEVDGAEVVSQGAFTFTTVMTRAFYQVNDQGERIVEIAAYGLNKGAEYSCKFTDNAIFSLNKYNQPVYINKMSVPAKPIAANKVVCKLPTFIADPSGNVAHWTGGENGGWTYNPDGGIKKQSLKDPHILPDYHDGFNGDDVYLTPTTVSLYLGDTLIPLEASSISGQGDVDVIRASCSMEMGLGRTPARVRCVQNQHCEFKVMGGIHGNENSVDLNLVSGSLPASASPWESFPSRGSENWGAYDVRKRILTATTYEGIPTAIGSSTMCFQAVATDSSCTSYTECVTVEVIAGFEVLMGVDLSQATTDTTDMCEDLGNVMGTFFPSVTVDVCSKESSGGIVSRYNLRLLISNVNDVVGTTLFKTSASNFNTNFWSGMPDEDHQAFDEVIALMSVVSIAGHTLPVGAFAAPVGTKAVAAGHGLEFTLSAYDQGDSTMNSEVYISHGISPVWSRAVGVNRPKINMFEGTGAYASGPATTESKFNWTPGYDDVARFYQNADFIANIYTSHEGYENMAVIPAFQGSHYVPIRVMWCEHEVQSTETLHSIAAMYDLSYLALWMINPEISNKGHKISVGDVVRIGRLYDVPMEDVNLKAGIDKLGSTFKQVLQANGERVHALQDSSGLGIYTGDNAVIDADYRNYYTRSSFSGQRMCFPARFNSKCSVGGYTGSPPESQSFQFGENQLGEVQPTPEPTPPPTPHPTSFPTHSPTPEPTVNENPDPVPPWLAA